MKVTPLSHYEGKILKIENVFVPGCNHVIL